METETSDQATVPTQAGVESSNASSEATNTAGDNVVSKDEDAAPETENKVCSLIIYSRPCLLRFRLP